MIFLYQSLFVDYILSFSLVGLGNIRFKSRRVSSLGAVLRSRRKDMTITICHNKPPERKWGRSVDDVIPRRDGPDNLTILKRVCWDWTVEARVRFWPLKDVVGFFWSLLTEILDFTRCAARWGGVSMVWLAKTFKNCVSLLASPWTEVRS